MRIGDVENCTLGELIDIISEYNEAETARTRLQWEALRIQTVILTNIHLPKHKTATPERLWPLPWDADTKPVKKANQISETTREKWRRWDEQMRNGTKSA